MQILQSLSTHVQVHSQHFFSKYVASVQNNCIIFCQKCFEIPAFCKYLPSLLRLFLPHVYYEETRKKHLQKQPPEVFYKNKFRKIHRKAPVSESLFNIVAGLTEHLRTTAFALRGTFFRNHESDCVPEMSLDYLQNINLLPFREILTFNFQQYWYKIVSVRDISCLSKGVWCMTQMCAEPF